MEKYLYSVGDTNDADYTATLEKITDEQLEKFAPIIDAINKFGSDTTNRNRHNYDATEWSNKNDCPTALYASDTISKELIEEFMEVVGLYGIHTLESIEVLEVASRKKLV